MMADYPETEVLANLDERVRKGYFDVVLVTRVS
jgi:hypothetical protein